MSKIDAGKKPIPAKFEPRARILTQLGDQLIKNESIALIELVKNSYDADASIVKVIMEGVDNSATGVIKIFDDGCGMSSDTVKDVWLEPGSDFKAQRINKNQISKKFGRLPIGEKGIGRFGVHKLGNVIRMTTKAENKPEVSVTIDWRSLNEHRYLKDVPITIYEKTEPTVFKGNATGTEIIISNIRKPWLRGEVRNIARALASLNSPFKSDDSFKLDLQVPDHPEWLKGLLSWDSIQDYSLFKFRATLEGDSIVDFEYKFIPWLTMNKLKHRVVGIDDPLVEDNLILRKTSRRKGKNVTEELINLSNFQIGQIEFEGFVFDMDSYILSLGLTQGQLDKQGLKGYLKENGGIRVFRDGLRVYDYGEPENDWLQLDHRRFQSPVKSISNNLVVGAIYLDRQSSTDLEEKTNREGFIENKAYEEFKAAILHTLNLVETLRMPDKKRLRDEYGATPKSEPVMHVLAETKRYVEEKVKDETVRDRIIKYLGEIEEDYKYMTETLLKAAGAGLTLSVVVHEVEKIISEVQRLLKKDQASENVLDLVQHLSSLIDGYSGIIQKSKLETISLSQIIDRALFNTEYRLKTHKIEVSREYRNSPVSQLKLAPTFIVSSLINMIDNSIYWLERKADKKQRNSEPFKKKIFISTFETSDCIHIVFVDNGVGFLIPTENLAQPFMTTKPDGIGLGLHIVSEVMKAQKGSLSFPEFDDFDIPEEFRGGALLTLTFKK